MNKKVSLGVTLALIFLSIAMTVSITVVIAMRHFGTMQMDLQQRVTMFDYVNDIDKTARQHYTIDEEKLRVLRRHNISRISINPQTLDDEVLQKIGRRHTAQQVIDCFEMARRMGFDNINMDLIMGLPGEDLDDLARAAGHLARRRKARPEGLC